MLSGWSWIIGGKIEAWGSEQTLSKWRRRCGWERRGGWGLGRTSVNFDKALSRGRAEADSEDSSLEVGWLGAESVYQASYVPKYMASDLQDNHFMRQ